MTWLEDHIVSTPLHWLDSVAMAAMDDIQDRADEYLDAHRPALMALIESAVDDLARTRLVLEHVDLSVAHAIAPYLDRLACRRGCDHCCHQLVMLQLGEARVLADAVGGLEADAQAKVRKQSRDQMSVVRAAVGAHPEENVADSGDRIARAVHEAGLPCPLLDVEHQVCRVYSARPSPCRAAYSFDAKRCSRHFGGDGMAPVEITEEMGIQMKSDPMIPSDRRLYPMGVVQGLLAAGRF